MMTDTNKTNANTTTTEAETRKAVEKSIDKWATAVIDHKVKSAVAEKVEEATKDISATIKAAVGDIETKVGDIKINVNPTINVTINPSITVGGSIAIDERRVENDLEAIARLLEVINKK